MCQIPERPGAETARAADPRDPVIRDLPRGGVLIRTSAGAIQYGATPETIKDTMELPGGVPSTYLLPRDLFLAERNLSVADLEFPAYYNFFVKNRRIRIVCAPHQVAQISTVLSEAIFGPKTIDLTREFVDGRAAAGFPDLLAELQSFRAHPKRPGTLTELEDFVEILPFDADNRVTLDEGIVIEQALDGWFRVVDQGVELAMLPKNIYLLPGEERFAKRDEPFDPPRFGVTIIGSGHGFDPREMTSGFVIWVNKKGILIDPPVDSTAWLRSGGIDPKMVDRLILTHCHADHDSGTLQKAFEEGRINIVTTETILGSFMRKYRTLTGLSKERFRSLFDWTPVRIGEPVLIDGAEFYFHYTLHSIPTVCFEVFFGGKSIVYSADHLNDPDRVRALHERGVIPPGRRDELLNFPWHHTLVFHEAGIPPIHTRIEYLATVPEDVKKRMYLIHVSGKSLPPGSNLQIAPQGVERTIRLDVTEPAFAPALEVLDVLAKIDLFRDLRVEKASEFLTLCRSEVYKIGATIIRAGTPGDRFYMIVSGRAAVLFQGEELKEYGKCDYFGETSLILGGLRNADVVAKTDLTCLVMDKYDFLYFIRGTDIPNTFRRIAENRALRSWEVFEESELFHPLSATQRTQLQAILHLVEFPRGSRITEEGRPAPDFYLIDTGRVSVTQKAPNGAAPTSAARGDFLGPLGAGKRIVSATETAIAEEDVVGYRIARPDFLAFLEKNPGVYVHFEQILRRGRP